MCMSYTPQDRPAGEAFVPMDPDELKTVKMLRNMKAQGLSGSMYSRDSLQVRAAVNDDRTV